MRLLLRIKGCFTQSERQQLIKVNIGIHVTLDEPVPALGHKSPRALARTKAGRGKVADWLKYIENSAAKAGIADPMASYDFTWMWEELGLIELRR